MVMRDAAAESAAMAVTWDELVDADRRRSREAIQDDCDHVAWQLGRRGAGIVWGRRHDLRSAAGSCRVNGS
jgi:hypothetical protein